MCIRDRCTTLSPALPYALFDRSITNATEVEQFNGNVVFEGIIDCAKKAIANDIPVVLGNDVGCPWITQYDFWRDLFYFHKYVCVSNAFALYTATACAAEMAGIGAETGTIEPGKSADLIVTAENPLEDLRALRKVEMVVTPVSYTHLNGDACSRCHVFADVSYMGCLLYTSRCV